jgi:hypothetical protein
MTAWDGRRRAGASGGALINFHVYFVGVPLPISKQQLNKLGERIAASDPPNKEDLRLLNEVLRSYQAILVTVEDQLALIGLSATSRVKTRGVLIDKLRRERGMALARVQDMAGARTVIEDGWVEQDAIVEQLKAHFDGWTGRESKVVDRRLTPSHGYRAVHVIVFPEGIPVEIQIRTELQNFWAQIVERLADRWGRGLRYGGDPEDAHLPAEGVAYPDGSPVTRQRIIYHLRNVAELIADIEKLELSLDATRRKPSLPLEQRIVKSLGREIDDLDADAARYYPRLRAMFKLIITTLRRAGVLAAPQPGGRKRILGRRRAGRIVRRTVPDVTAPDADFVRGKMLRCDTFVEDVVAEQRSRLKQQQATLRATLQELGAYVEQGSIR